MYRIGVDVGGTNTDAALLDVAAVNSTSRGVISSSKVSTTSDITSGVRNAIEDVLTSCNVLRSKVLSVNIGTTHFVNAVVEADESRLSKVAVVRLCGPYTRQLPPFSGFPVSLERITNGGVWYIDGGLNIDGSEISPLNPTQIRDVVSSIKNLGITNVALIAVFSSLDHSGLHEERCKKIILDMDPTMSITCSHDIGPSGLLERENATILNAAIFSVAKRAIIGFQKAVSQLKLTCPLFLTQNDGTLTDVDSALRLPIRCFASGPTNSAIGAAFLAALDESSFASGSEEAQNLIVVDIGGTTTDVCALSPSGFPRQAPGFVEVGGVRTAFSMPEVCSIGLGGGSRVSVNDADEITIGPDSVGHLLDREAVVFGGRTLTTTDVAVARSGVKLGEPSLVENLSKDFVNRACSKIRRMLESVIDQMKVSADPVTVILVGGGSILFSDELNGVASCIRPPHHGSANAVGAAIAKVAGEVDMIELLEGSDEKVVVANAIAKAVDTAANKGAAPETIKVVEIDKTPLQYATNKATRIRVKTAGLLQIPPSPDTPEITPTHSPVPRACVDLDGVDIQNIDEKIKQHTVSDVDERSTKPSLGVDIALYRPKVNAGVWHLSEIDLEFIATGTGILGTGGGGSTYVNYLAALHALRTKGPGSMRVISPKTLQDSDLVCYGAWYGAPTAMNERLASGNEIILAIDTNNRQIGYTEGFQALIADEIGGGNGLASFPLGAHYDRPIVDADGMGRAYPSQEHNTPSINGFPLTPCTVADGNGNIVTVMHAESPKKLEKLLRQAAIELGLSIGVAQRALPGSAIRNFAVPNSISQAWYLGRAVHLARKSKKSYADAIFEIAPGRLLFSGKVVDVRRDIKAGYTQGRCIIASLPESEQETGSGVTGIASERHLVIPFQNEYLFAAYTDSDNTLEEEVICTVPDLISILDQDGEGLGSQDLRFGLRVQVIAIPAHPMWTHSEQGLKVGGPEGFGLDMPFVGVGEYSMPKSVIETFGV